MFRVSLLGWAENLRLGGCVIISFSLLIYFPCDTCITRTTDARERTNDEEETSLTNMTGTFAAIMVGLGLALANTAKSDLE